MNSPEKHNSKITHPSFCQGLLDMIKVGRCIAVAGDQPGLTYEENKLFNRDFQGADHCMICTVRAAEIDKGVAYEEDVNKNHSLDHRFLHLLTALTHTVCPDKTHSQTVLDTSCEWCYRKASIFDVYGVKYEDIGEKGVDVVEHYINNHPELFTDNQLESHEEEDVTTNHLKS